MGIKSQIPASFTSLVLLLLLTLFSCCQATHYNKTAAMIRNQIWNSKFGQDHFANFKYNSPGELGNNWKFIPKKLSGQASSHFKNHKFLDDYSRNANFDLIKKKNRPNRNSFYHKSNASKIADPGSTSSGYSYYSPPAAAPSANSTPDYKYGEIALTYQAPAPITTTAAPLTTAMCTKGFSSLTADLSLISLFLSIISLIFGIVSLMISNFYNVWGSALSLIFIGIPTFITNTLSLAGVTLPSGPLATFLSLTSIFDVFNNALSIIPGSLFSDLLGLISLIVGKISLGLGAISSYPQPTQKVLQYLGLKDIIDKNYACGAKTLGTVLQDLLNGSVSMNEQQLP